MALTLNDHELRVLGVLIEKSLTQAGSYPLTLNAVVLGANQKQNREPVMNLREADVGAALHALNLKDLVKHAAAAPGARANRFGHNVVERLHWDRREQAVMAELMLRGWQTAGELRTRGDRMTALQDVTAVNSILQGLASGDTVFVEELPREPGRSSNRFRHLLSAEAANPVPPAPTSIPAGVASTASAVTGEEHSLTERVTRLEAQVADLTHVVAELRKNDSGTVDQGDATTI